MGNRIPVPDERTKGVIDKLRLENKDIKKLWNVFRRSDKDHSGTIDINEFYRLIEEEKNVFGDSIFELIECEANGNLDFGEFLSIISTYCMFGKKEILQFCFFIFDKDKNGYIEQDELTSLIDLLHKNTQYSNTKHAMLNAFDEDQDGKMSFKEFSTLNNKYPQLLYPAFRMQDQMMAHTLGVNWWRNRRTVFAEERMQKQQQTANLAAGERERVEKLRNRQIRRKMGFFQYYFNVNKRNKYLAQVQADAEKKKEAEMEDDDDDSAEEEKQREREEQEMEWKKAREAAEGAVRARKEKRKRAKRDLGESKSNKSDRAARRAAREEREPGKRKSKKKEKKKKRSKRRNQDLEY